LFTKLVTYGSIEPIRRQTRATKTWVAMLGRDSSVGLVHDLVHDEGAHVGQLTGC